MPQLATEDADDFAEGHLLHAAEALGILRSMLHYTINHAHSV